MPLIAIQEIPGDVSELSVCSIDLGFAKNQPSTGIAFGANDNMESAEMFFGEGVQLVNRWLEELVPKRRSHAVLILEAPLSMAMTADNNPCHRQIELPINYVPGHAPLSPKGWFYQAGANLSLGSTILLRQLHVPKKLKVLLVEGFYCRMGAGEPATPHVVVAQALITKLLENAGAALVTPSPETQGGTTRLLPGVEGIVDGIPGILLREGMRLR